MKKSIAATVALTALVFTLPLFFGKREDRPTKTPTENNETPVKTEIFRRTEPEMIYIPQEPEAGMPEESKDGRFYIRVLTKGETETVDLHTYLCGVVASEMPASFDSEALKAQAVAARTFILYRMSVEPSDRHPDADVCDDISCCKAYFTEEELKQRWGDQFMENRRKIEGAVYGTDGLCLTYGGKPIFAAFHSSSPGYTESAGNVFGQDLPYLQSVFSPENSASVPNYSSEVKVGFEEFRKTVFEKYPGAVFSPDPDTWITDVERSASGRIVSLKVGGTELSGTLFRQLFSLRSAFAEIERTADGFTFSVTGYGHGVGMSQYGAEALAKAGSDFEEILAWYYTDAELSDMLAVCPEEPESFAGKND